MFDAKPLGPSVATATVFYRAADAPTIMPKWREWAEQLPDEVTTRALFFTMPAAPALPPAVHDQEVFIIVAMYAGEPGEGTKVVEPARHFADPLADVSGEVPFRFFQSDFDPLVSGLHSYWKSTYLNEFTHEVMQLILDCGMNRSDPWTLVHVPRMGGATSRVAAGQTAFGDRSARWMLSIDGNWKDPKQADSVIPWVRRSIARANELTGVGGAYLNFSADDAGNDHVVREQFGQNMGVDARQ